MNKKIVDETIEYALELYKFNDDIVTSIEDSILFYERKYTLSPSQVNELRQDVLDSLDPEVYK